MEKMKRMFRFMTWERIEEMIRSKARERKEKVKYWPKCGEREVERMREIIVIMKNKAPIDRDTISNIMGVPRTTVLKYLIMLGDWKGRSTGQEVKYKGIGFIKRFPQYTAERKPGRPRILYDIKEGST
jgi:predicted ArsR family transcriptional regulator